MPSPLISPEELLQHIAAPNLVILDARPSAAEYAASHVRGAIHADLETQLSSAKDPGADAARGGRHPLPPLGRWSEQLGAWGITPQHDVVIYDDQDGANAAARAWWMLRSVGHERVRVVDGGFRALVAAGVPIDSAAVQPNATSPYPATNWQWSTVDIDDVDTLRNDASWRVLDVRAAARYRGETEPIDPIAGHIPGAINKPFAENLANGRFKSADELRRDYRELFGEVPVDHVIVHCGSGVTACHTLLALDAAGLHGASLYVGSWGEWCRNDRQRAKVN